MTFHEDDRGTADELSPWPVILASLFELDSYEIPGIIDSSGMTVDWRLTERQNYSHKYRKAAYRPRINRTYETLSADDRLRVAFIVARELVSRGLAHKLNTNLQRIGWRIVADALAPTTAAVRELFFPPGTQHDAYVQIRRIVHQARRSIRIVDPYLDGTVFAILGDVQRPLTVELLGAKLPTDFSLEAAKYQQQQPGVAIETRRSRDFHDRFIVVDVAKCWHIGCSIKDAGNKAFMLSMIEDSTNSRALLETLDITWANADPLS